MQVLEPLLQLFTSSISGDPSFENQVRFEKTVSVTSLKVPTKESFDAVLSQVNFGDIITVDFRIGDSEPVSFYSQTSQSHDFLSNLEKGLSYHESGESIVIKITIHKNHESILNIYDSEAFLVFMEGLTLQELLLFFYAVPKQGETSFWRTLDSSLNFETQYIKSASSNVTTTTVDEAQKSDRISRVNSVCHYSNASQFQFLPEDFKLITKSAFSNLNKLFDKLAIVHCVISLFDITSIQEDKINYKVSGFKSFQGNLDFKNIQTNSLEDYFKIYSWTFNGGNLADKIGLVRNILSIHFDTNVVTLVGSPYYSINSSYEIYLKQNIKQYIDVRNKITDQLSDLTKKANSIVEDFAKNFKTSIFTFLSFFTSVFILRVLSKGDFKKIVTTEAAILSLGFLFIAFIYLKFSQWELTKQKERLGNNYKNLKSRYKDLLMAGDIEKILNDDKDYLDDIAFIDEKNLKYRQLWYSTLVAFFIVIGILYYLAEFYY